MKTTAFTRSFYIFSKSSYFKLNFGRKQSKIGLKFAEQWLPKAKISKPFDDRRPDFSKKNVSTLIRAIFCKRHPTCDSKVFRISSYFNQLKIKVILEYGRNFGFIKHFVEFLGGGGGGSRDNSSFSRNAISVPKLYFESHLSLLELLFRV